MNDSERHSPTEQRERFHAEAWPSGGWAVKLTSHPVPVSRHDTEEEAHAKAAAYERGIERSPRAQRDVLGATPR